MIDRMEAWLRGWRMRLSRSRWSIRRMGLELADAAPAEMGLVLVYVDGLAYQELEQAIADGWMPFCRTLRSREAYRIHALDTSSHLNPAAMQRELFYGRPTSPAAALHQHEPHSANGVHVEDALPLLAGGSQYGGLCDGGAAESHDCSIAVGRSRVGSLSGRFSRLGFAMGHAGLLVYLGAATVAESGGALASVLAGRDSFSTAWSNGRHRLDRALRQVLSREFTVMGSALDVARGLPIVHLSLALGSVEDEQIARWQLRGLDAALRRIWRAARHAERRDYDIWIYTRPSHDAQRGAALVPVDVPIAARGQTVLHVSDIRAAALHALGKGPLPAAVRLPAQHRHEVLRVMTYNVHSCLGMDGKLSPARIARVIAQCDADVVALQELDVSRARTGGIDQAKAIAEILQMDFHFHPALALEEERYGDAVLSRYPIRLRRAGPIPGLPTRPELEPRGAQWLTIDFPGQEVQLVNTHLGLVAAERANQVNALMGPEWLGHPDCQGPVIFCGDLNALPSSLVCKRLGEKLSDAQYGLNGHRPKQTFFVRLPIGRIDHVFVSNHWEVVDVQVPRSDIIRRASDHLPLIVDLRLANKNAAVTSQPQPLQPAL